MEKLIVILTYLIACLGLHLITCDNCCEINSRQLPYYKLMKSNARSNQLILSRKTVQNVNECRKFASVKKALAFNYGLDDDYGKTKDADWKRIVMFHGVQSVTNS